MVQIAIPRRVNRDSSYSELSKRGTRLVKRYTIPKNIVEKKDKPTPVASAETFFLQKELRDLQTKIKAHQKRCKAIKNELQKRGARTTGNPYFNRKIQLYVLQLEDNCWYVGQSRNVEKRFNRFHMKGKGANWTKLHKPIAIHEIRETNTNVDSEAALLEDKLTLEYAEKYGTAFVRGGGYCQTKPIWPV